MAVQRKTAMAALYADLASQRRVAETKLADDLAARRKAQVGRTKHTRLNPLYQSGQYETVWQLISFMPFCHSQ